MNKHPKPWKFGVTGWIPETDTEDEKKIVEEKPLDYRSSDTQDSDSINSYPSIYDANGERVVGSDEQYVFSGPHIVQTIRLIPEMLDLLEKLAAGYDPPKPEPGDDIYESNHNLILECDHFACLSDDARELLEKIKGGL